MRSIKIQLLTVFCLMLALAGCKSSKKAFPADSNNVGVLLPRAGDEIVVCGQYFHTGTAIVLWNDPGGYDAYRVDRRFAPQDQAGWCATTQEVASITSPNRYGLRFQHQLNTDELNQVRGGGWPLPMLQDKVDQFVIHYDVAGTSQNCFKILHDQRDLSVHFLLDIDGTIYQTLDLKERAWHASEANDRSVGVEVANMGAYPLNSSTAILREWYKRMADGTTQITVPARYGTGGVRTPNFVGAPVRSDPVYGFIQHAKYRQYDYTPQQYDALIKLTATLCTVFPKLRCDYPRDLNGQLIPHALTGLQLEDYSGILGHYHVTPEKQDPGPAFQWDRLIDGSRKLMAH